MRQVILLIGVTVFSCAGLWADTTMDTFGTGANQFTIDFVTIAGDTGDLGNWSAGSGYTFSGVDHGDYRMGKFEITNDQWTKFANSLSVPVTGSPSTAYNYDPYFTGLNVPTNAVSWYEAAQFVNWLNTSTNHEPAYKFTGTQGTGDYSFEIWQPGDTGYDASNPFRNSNAKYFLPTEDEWVKAAYWNGTNLQTWATPDDTQPLEDIETNYGYETGAQPWAVGSGLEEFNGTFDMMGNVWEWMESPYISGNYLSGSYRGLRGSAFSYYDGNGDNGIRSSYRSFGYLAPIVYKTVGFRVASVPEPCSLLILTLGGLMLRKTR